jgi:hypothetical protein
MSNAKAAEKAERALVEFRQELMATAPEAVDLLAVEKGVLELVRQWGAAVMAQAMKRADTEAPEVVIGGERWGNRRVHKHTYETMFGAIEVERSTYQKSGGGRVAVPMDLRLGIVESRYTPLMGRVLTKAVALMPEAEAEDFLREVGVAMVSKSTLHRIPRAMAARYETRRESVEAAVRERDPIPQTAVTVQVSLDGVMVPQDGEYARARGRKTESPQPARHEKRYGPPEGEEPPADSDECFGRSWHEGSVGTIAYFDAEGNRLKTTYLARMPEPHKATLVVQLEQELWRVIGDLPAVNVQFASDGAAAQWNALKAMRMRLPDTFSGHTMMLLDFYHAAEYVQDAANAVYGEGSADAKVFAAQWAEMMKHREDGARSVLKAMRYQRDKMPRGKDRTTLIKSIKFLAKQQRRGRMKYAEAQQRNYPIGTGVTEAAAKTVVNVRMKRAGARFSQHGGQTVMLFRTAILSQRFDLLHQELRATYAARIAA